MPDLKSTFHGVDLQYLRHVAEKWGIPLDAPDVRHGLPHLVEKMTAPDLVVEMVDALPSGARAGLEWLVEHKGRAPWDLFTRRFGEVREMGSGKRERERPDLDPISPAEVLWYRAFISRGFFDSEEGPKEYAYIPDDLRRLVAKELLPAAVSGKEVSQVMLARKATPEERNEIYPATHESVDDTCTILAGLRAGVNYAVHLPDVSQMEIKFYLYVFQTLGLMDEDRSLHPDSIRDFFELSRGRSLFHVWQGWRSSSRHDDLALTPGLQAEGTWDSNPLKVRSFILEVLSQLPAQTWLSISSFVARIHQHHPDFLRSGGEFDSWYIKDEQTGEYLRGYEHWDDVEGAFLRYLLRGPLHWLGVLDLGKPDPGLEGPWTAFRISKMGMGLLAGKAPELSPPGADPIKIRSKGLIKVSSSVPRKIRYQIARFCDWKPMKKGDYMFLLTPSSLKRARAQGLEVPHLLTLLEGHAELVPPNIIQALNRWDRDGAQAVMREETVLRVGSPAILKALQESRAKRFLGERLGSTVVVIKEGSEEKIAEVLAEMGFFADTTTHKKGS